MCMRSAEKYATLLEGYQPLWPTDLMLEAEELCSFFRRHVIDPYSALIGMVRHITRSQDRQ